MRAKVGAISTGLLRTRSVVAPTVLRLFNGFYRRRVGGESERGRRGAAFDEYEKRREKSMRRTREG